MEKGFREYVQTTAPDVLCLQEVKAEPQQVDLSWADEMGYHQAWDNAVKKGYSGVCIWSKQEPIKFRCGIGIEEHDQEGRVVTATYDQFHLVSVYTPNAQRGLARLDYRMEWDAAFLKYIKKLKRTKPVIFCGDLNCAHQEIDLANPKANRKNAGFSDEERSSMDKIFKAGFVDTFRKFESGPDHYTWWTYRNNARERNIGWRLDYFFASDKIADCVVEAVIRDDVFGSDHCPVEILLNQEVAV